MRIRRFAAALLALMLVLTGCGKDNGKTEKPVFQTAPNYHAEEISLPAEAGELEGCCTDGRSIWYLAVPAEDAAPVLCRIPLDGEAEVLPEYQPPVKDGEPARGYLGPVLGGDGMLWVWEQFYIAQYDLPEDFDPETDSKDGYFAGSAEFFQMRQLDPETGKERKRVDITAAMEDVDILFLNGAAVDKTGTIYLSDRKKITAVDGQGQVAFTLAAKLPDRSSYESAGGMVVPQPDGTVAVLTANKNERTVRTIDRAAKDWGERSYTIQPGVEELYGGMGEVLFYYLKDATIYGMTEGDELPQPLLPWANARLRYPSSALRCFALLDDGQAALFICTNGSGRYAGQFQAIRLFPTEEAPDAQVRLIYGMIGENRVLRQRVDVFNQRSKDYFIEVRDYTEGMLSWADSGSQLYQSALTRLYADIAAGNGPDILDGSVPLEALSRQGALEDLWPWIEQDPEVGRETVMEHVLECIETEGKLYRICGGFGIETAVASAAVAGDRTGWTMEEMLDAFGGRMPELYFGGLRDPRLIHTTFNRYDKISALYNLVRMNLDCYVDWESGECSFDGEAFRALLQMCGSISDIENGTDVTDVRIRWQLGLPLDRTVRTAEPCRVSPWEGGPVLYTRTLDDPFDLVVDDPLFGGPEALTDYEQRLWEAGIYRWHTLSTTGKTIRASSVYTEGTRSIRSAVADHEDRIGDSEPLAADYMEGGLDGNVYASYVGLPAQGGAGSSFVLYDVMAISSMCEAKEGAWAFLRSLLLPGGNTVHWNTGYTLPTVNGLPMDRASFEGQLEMQWCVNESTGEYYLDASGERIEYPIHGLGIGDPDPLVMLVYLTYPSQAQLERFWNLYNSIGHVSGGDEELLNIITEQAQPYFAGDKSLEDTAKQIQNRARLYINENR